ncbi:hypothetical protein R1flu_028635 [Riccia fluitans]|uniref:Uncharacterized protein n=1 Tax=Riccia fluitans TaxID=41844 RepID=A0ABD1XMB4_9MARC
MADEAAGQRLPTIRLMDEELYNTSTTEQIQKFRSQIQFVPYTFKEMKDLDLVKILAMYCLNMLKYVALLQKHCVPKDIFLWGLQNKDTEGDRLLVKDVRGGTNIIGWNKIAIVLERSTMTQRISDPSRLRRNLFVGTPLEEAEGWIGWTHVTKDTDMTLPQLHSKFPKLITSLSHLRQRCQLPEEIPIASPEQAVSTRRPRAEDKQPEEFVPTSPKQPVSSQRPEDIPIALPEQPVSSKRPRAEDKERGLPSKKKNKLIVVVISKTAVHVKRDEGQSNGPRVRFTQPLCPNIPTGVTTPQPVPTSGELSESTGAIFVEDLNGTSNDDSAAKPPNVSISLALPLPPPPPPAYYHSCNWRTWKASIDGEAIREGVECYNPTGHISGDQFPFVALCSS